MTGRKRKRLEPQTDEIGNYLGWGDNEIDSFFYALSRYGSHGLDEIAKEVKTKSFMQCQRFLMDLEAHEYSQRPKRLATSEYAEKKWIDYLCTEATDDAQEVEKKEAEYRIREEEKEYRKHHDLIRFKLDPVTNRYHSSSAKVSMFRQETLLQMFRNAVERDSELAPKAQKAAIGEECEKELRAALRGYLRTVIRGVIVFAIEKRKNTATFEDVTAADVQKALAHFQLVEKKDKVRSGNAKPLPLSSSDIGYSALSNSAADTPPVALSSAPPAVAAVAVNMSHQPFGLLPPPQSGLINSTASLGLPQQKIFTTPHPDPQAQQESSQALGIHPAIDVDGNVMHMVGSPPGLLDLGLVSLNIPAPVTPQHHMQGDANQSSQPEM